MAVPRKGTSHQKAMEQVVEWVDQLGHETIIIKCDYEPIMIQVQEEIMRRRKGKQTIPENSPVGESSSNGMVENAVREVEAWIRTIRAHVQNKAGVEIPSGSALMAWLVQHVGTLLTRVKVRPSTGLTAYEALKGKPSVAPMVAFAENVMFMPTNNKTEKLKETTVSAIYKDGIF